MKPLIIIATLLVSIVHAEFNEDSLYYYYKNVSNLIKSDKSIKSILLPDIDKVSIEISYISHGELPIKPQRNNIYNYYKSNLIITVSQDDNAIWRNLFYNSLDSVCTEGIKEVPTSVLDFQIKLLFVVKLYYKKQMVTLGIPVYNLKTNDIRWASKGTVYFFKFNDKAISNLGIYLQNLIKLTVPKDLSDSILNTLK